MSKKAKQVTKKEKRKSRVRQERRFLSQASANTTLVRAVGALASLLLGGGVWAYFYAQSFAEDEKLKNLPSYLIAGGAVLMGIAIWFGTSSESPVRVGAPGIAVEKGELRRMPWWSIEKITFDSSAIGLVVTGKDESGVDWTFKVPMRSHPEAVTWIVKEATDRIPSHLDIADELRAKLPEASTHAGMLVDLEPLQVVGRKDAVSGKTISYEPDACVCPLCERVYLKRSVPKTCACGNSLASFRPKDAAADDEGEGSSDAEPTEVSEETADG